MHQYCFIVVILNITSNIYSTVIVLNCCKIILEYFLIKCAFEKRFSNTLKFRKILFKTIIISCDFITDLYEESSYVKNIPQKSFLVVFQHCYKNKLNSLTTVAYIYCFGVFVILQVRFYHVCFSNNDNVNIRHYK